MGGAPSLISALLDLLPTAAGGGGAEGAEGRVLEPCELWFRSAQVVLKRRTRTLYCFPLCRTSDLPCIFINIYPYPGRGKAVGGRGMARDSLRVAVQVRVSRSRSRRLPLSRG